MFINSRTLIWILFLTETLHPTKEHVISLERPKRFSDQCFGDTEHRFKVNMYSLHVLAIDWQPYSGVKKQSFKLCSEGGCIQFDAYEDDPPLYIERNKLQYHCNYTVSRMKDGKCLFEQEFYNPPYNPGPPENGKVSISGNEVKVQWDAPKVKNGELTGYIIRLKDNSQEVQVKDTMIPFPLEYLRDVKEMEIYAFNEYQNQVLLSDPLPVSIPNILFKESVQTTPGTENMKEITSSTMIPETSPKNEQQSSNEPSANDYILPIVIAVCSSVAITLLCVCLLFFGRKRVRKRMKR